MRNLPTVTRYLLIANFCVFFLAAILQRYGIAVAGYAVTQAAYNQEHVGGLEVRPLADLLPAHYYAEGI